MRSSQTLSANQRSARSSTDFSANLWGLGILRLLSFSISFRAVRALLVACLLVSAPVAAADDFFGWLPGDQYPLSAEPPVDAPWQKLEDAQRLSHDWREGGWVAKRVPEPEHDLLLIKKAWWRSAEAWVPMQGGGWQRQQLGFDHDNGGRLYSGRFLGLRLPENIDRSEPVYLWLEHDRPSSLLITSVDEASYLRQDLIYLRLIMLFFGILLALAVYHLLIFIWLRQRAFGLYVLYLLCVGGFFLAQEGLLYLWQWPGWKWIGSGISNTLAAWTIAFATLFVSDFVRMGVLAPRFDRFLLRWPAYVLLLTGALSLFASGALLTVLAQFSAIGALTLTPMVIAAGIAAWRQKEIAGIYVTAAWSLVVLAVSYRVLYGFGLTPLDAITMYGTQVAVALEAMLLAIGLAHKIARLRAERDAARTHLAREQRLLLHRQILNELGRGLAASRDADNVFALTLAAVERAFVPSGILFVERQSGQVIAQRGSAASQLPALLQKDQLEALRQTAGCLMIERQLDPTRALILIILDARVDATPQLLEEFADMAMPALRSVDYLKAVQHRADYDALTGMLSRAHFEERAKQQLTGPERERVALAFMDLDHFKLINDRYGHGVGDEILAAVGQRIRHCLREDELIGRYGGEEFVALFPDLDARHAEQMCHRIRDEVGRKPYRTRFGLITVTMSIGLSVADTPVALEKLLEEADRRLYRAKEEGRDRMVG